MRCGCHFPIKSICVAKLALELDFRAETTFTEGLHGTVDWHLDN
jgi:hypothetical protein